MSFIKVASRYAKSLIELAQERGELEKVYEDVQMFQQVAENKDFKMVLSSPIITTKKKREVFNAIFDGNVTELMGKFLTIVLDKNREDALPAIMRSFISQYRAIKQISDLKITSAVALSDNAIEKIKQKLIAENAINPNVDITTEIDPSLLGGVILEFEGRQYNASIASKLKEVKKGFLGRNLYVSQIEKK